MINQSIIIANYIILIVKLFAYVGCCLVSAREFAWHSMNVCAICTTHSDSLTMASPNNANKLQMPRKQIVTSTQ